MNKATKIIFYKKQLSSSKTMKEVAMQNYNLATQLESEALRALEMLGNTPKHARKGKTILPEGMKLELQASLTK